MSETVRVRSVESRDRPDETVAVKANRQAARWSGVLIAAVVFLAYVPALGAGFWMDDYIAIDIAGRVSGIGYLFRFFDPFVQRLWYRPMIGMQWKVEYLLFRGDPTGYHAVQIAIHLANCLLLSWLTTRITRKWQVGLVAALLYAPLPLASMAIYWPSVHDPLAGVFYLLGLILWLDYVESGSRLKSLLAFASFLGALLTKEIGATLPLMHFLADRLLINRPEHWQTLVKRYSAFVPPLAIYALCELIVSSRSEFTSQIGYSVGVQNIQVFLRFLSLLVFPWNANDSFRFVWTAAIGLVFLYTSLTRDRRLLFLGAAGILPIIIVTPIPAHLFNPRYLYLALMASAVGASLLVHAAFRVFRDVRRFAQVLAAAALVFVALYGINATGEQATNFGGYIRQIRLQFRSIYSDHPSLPPDTFLYFVDTPLQTLDISGLMFLRYGPGVSVGGVDQNQIPGLRSHQANFVGYLNQQGVFETAPVDKDSSFEIASPVPVRFQDSISLEAIDIASARVKPGHELVVIPCWRVSARVAKDYTVFAHVLDANQHVVAGVDGQPRRGAMPTSSWRAGSLVPDGIVIPVGADVARGTYMLEMGLYDLTTMERLAMVDKDGQPAGDRLLLGPIQVEAP